MGTEFSTAKPDLQAIEVLTPSNDDILQRKAGAWVNRTIAQFKTDLNYTIPVASDTAYDATSWDGNLDVPTKNAIRDKIETMGGIGGSTGATDNAILRADGTGGATVQSSGAVIDDNGYLAPATSGAAGTPNLYSLGDTNTGFALWGSDAVTFISGGASQVGFGGGANGFNAGNGFQYGWNPNGSAFGGGNDTALMRSAAGVVKATNGATGIRGFLGGGTAVASATALPLPTGRVFHVTGTTTITSITATNLESGVVITLIFDDVLTFTDGNNLILAGNFVTSANDTITLAFDGTNFYEMCRSVN